jgi:hypothetical protein
MDRFWLGLIHWLFVVVTGYSFYPVTFHAEDKFAVRDAGARRDLGVFTVAFTAEVEGHDARIFRLKPLPD